MKNLGQIKILPAREQVASILRKAILSGDFKEGQELTLDEIASQVGVSSMPVREAFQMLANDGLIQLRHNKGAIVLGINEKTIRDHYLTRALLESECCSIVSKKGVDISQIEEVYMLSEETMKNNDYKAYSDLNQSFHMAIWETAGNSKIISILSTMWNGLSMGYQVSEEEYAKTSFSEHTQILEIIRSNDEEAARKIMYEHIIRSMNDILTNLSHLS